jgi:ubiquinone/menaquinone biosynthesis C-methylase UbiE
MNTPENMDMLQHFERWSSTYETSILQRILFDRVQASLLAAIPMDTIPESIMDVGCGTGRLLGKMAARWPSARLIGVDPTPGMIVEARQNIPRGTFHVGAAESLPVADQSVDLVLTTVSFHHWADQVQGLREVARVLHPGGCFFLADLILPHRWATIYPHFRPNNPMAVRGMFAQAGLNVRAQHRLLATFLLITVGERL